MPRASRRLISVSTSATVGAAEQSGEVQCLRLAQRRRKMPPPVVPPRRCWARRAVQDSQQSKRILLCIEYRETSRLLAQEARGVRITQRYVDAPLVADPL